jgi:hypothetical protein
MSPEITAYTSGSPRIFLKQIINIFAVGASTVVKHVFTCTVDFCLPTLIVSSEVTPTLIVNCCSQAANMFFFNKASWTGTTTEISSSGKKNPFVVKN